VNARSCTISWASAIASQRPALLPMTTGARGWSRYLGFCGCASGEPAPDCPGGPSWPSYGRYALIAEFRYAVNMIVRYELEVRAPRVKMRARSTACHDREGTVSVLRPVHQSRYLQPGIRAICQENTQGLSGLRPSTRLFCNHWPWAAAAGIMTVSCL
jgi:hypothetical protein